MARKPELHWKIIVWRTLGPLVLVLPLGFAAMVPQRAPGFGDAASGLPEPEHCNSPQANRSTGFVPGIHQFPPVY